MGSQTFNVNGTGTVWNVTAGTFTPGTSVINILGATATFVGGSKTYADINITGSGSIVVSGANGFTNFTRTATAALTDGLSFAGNQTISGTLTLNGNSVLNRLNVFSSVVGTTRTITAAAVSTSNADYMDITGAGVASPFTGTSLGDCNGNSGITFTTPATQTWSGTSGGNWSANAWTSRVPLPQDDVVINAAFAASQTITLDMPRAGKSINFTGVTGSPIFSTPSNFTMFGSLTFTATMTRSGINTAIFAGRSAYTITSAGNTFQQILFNSATGTYTLQDAFSCASTLTVTSGTLDGNNQNVTCLNLGTAGTITRAITFGSGTWTFTQVAALTFVSVSGTGVTISAASATFVLLSASANNRTFAGGGFTYGTLTYTVAGSTGQLIITGANTFTTINFNDTTNARTIVFPLSTINTVTNLNISSLTSPVMSIISSSSGTPATISVASGTVALDYVSIKDITATGGATFYAGSNSTDATGNTGWIFSTPYLVSPAGGVWSATGTWVGGVVPPGTESVVQANATSGNLTLDVTASIRSLDFTGYTGTFTHNAAVGLSVGGVLSAPSDTVFKLVSGMTYTLGNTATSTMTYAATTSVVQGIDFGGKTAGLTTINGGSFVLLSNFTSAVSFALSLGGFSSSSFNVQIPNFSSNVTTVRTLNMGTGTWTLTSTPTIWSVNYTNLTVLAANTTIVSSGNNATARTFNGGANTYGTFTYIVGTGQLTLSGGSTFGTLNVTSATTKTVVFASGTTTTILTTFNITGSASGLVSITNAAAATLSKSSGTVSVDYLNITNSTASGGATWYAGANSVNSGGNTGWIFTAPSAGTGVNYNLYTEQAAANLLYGTSVTRYSLQEVVNLASSSAWPTQYSTQERLNRNISNTGRLLTVQEILQRNLTTALSLSSTRSYTVQRMLNEAYQSGVSIVTVVGL